MIAGQPSARPAWQALPQGDVQRSVALNLAHALTFLRAAGLGASTADFKDQTKRDIERAILSASSAQEMLP